MGFGVKERTACGSVSTKGRHGVRSARKAGMESGKLERAHEGTANISLLIDYSLFCTKTDLIDTDEFHPPTDNYR